MNGHMMPGRVTPLHRGCLGNCRTGGWGCVNLGINNLDWLLLFTEIPQQIQSWFGHTQGFDFFKPGPAISEIGKF